MSEENVQPPCEKCGGKCCNYIAVEIDKPGSKADYDHIRWYLLHNDVNVFIDHDKKWFIEFRTTCEEQDSDNRCSIYERRPKICRTHGSEEYECEYYDSPYYKYFSFENEFLNYLENKGIKWEFKNLK